MQQQVVNPSALRNARHMRHAMGFYPTEKDQENAQWFLDLNDSCVEWLKDMKISGKNARKSLAEMSKFASDRAQALVDDHVFQSIDEAYTMSYATLLTAVGSFERFLSSQRKRELPSDFVPESHYRGMTRDREYAPRRSSSGGGGGYQDDRGGAAYRTQHRRR